MKSKTFGSVAFDIVIYVVLLLLGLICLLPILNAVAISFSDKTSAALGEVFIWPVNFNTASYKEILKERLFFTAYLNSFVRVLVGGTINICLAILTAYPLSKSNRVFRGRNVYMWILVFTMLFNGGIVPNFILIKELKLMDTIWALVLPNAVAVFSVILLMNFFKGIPKSLEEAAFIDGASPLYVLVKLFIPLAKPAIATISLFAVVNHWNSFFDGKMYINSPAKMPLQTYIQSLTADANRILVSKEEVLRQMQMSNVTFNSAKIVVSMLPILIIYPFLQKYFVTGIVMGAVKE